MEIFRKFLSPFRCEKGSGLGYTHTSIGNPRASYAIPDDKMDDFYEAYTRAVVQGIPLHLTEKPFDPSPMRADLDFRFAMPTPKPDKIGRIYTNNQIETIVKAYGKLIAAYINPEFHSEIVAYVMEKPNPTEYRGKIKDGIHIVWPHIVLSHNLQHLIRKHMLDNATNVFAGLAVCNTFEDIIDAAIIDKNNWQLYGSKKPDCDAYRVTAIYEYVPTGYVNGTLKRRNQPTAVEELQYAKLLSMRSCRIATPICESKLDEIDQYIRHVLPSHGEKRQSKLNAQIFGKSINMNRNCASDDDFLLSKEMVECLNPKRAENYEDWIKLGWTLRNIDHRLLDSWVDFSRVSNKYVEGECQRLWNTMRTDTLGIGTLRWWARQDNPQKYEEVRSHNVTILIDRCCASSGAHYDIACVVHALYKDKYRFTTKDTWFMYVEEKHRWVRTREGLKLRIVLSNDVWRRYADRAYYWSGEAGKASDQNDQERFNAKSKTLTEICTKLKTAGFKDSVMKECKSLFTDEHFEEMLDSHTHLLGFENGVYDLRLHEFREGLPDDYTSFTTGRHYINYDPTSQEAQEIEGYLSQVFTNENVRKYMKNMLACIIDGSIRQEKFYIFTGSGSNSKSIYLNLLQRAIGDYYCILPIALLTQKRSASNAAQSELERTKGRRCAVMQEPGESEKLNIGLMKELSGGDRILARGLFKEPIEFKPQFKMIMTCNELPEVPSDDGGTWRRIRVIEYISRFLDNPDPNNPKEFPIDPDLVEKLERWSDTFISMIIDHHKKFDAKTLVEPMEVRIATEGYKKNNDVIGQYVGEKIQNTGVPSDRLQLQKLFQDFKAWAFLNVAKGKKLPDRGQLRAYMEKTYGAYPNGGKGWKGLKAAAASAEEQTDVEGEGDDIDDDAGPPSPPPPPPSRSKKTKTKATDDGDGASGSGSAPNKKTTTTA